MLTTSQPSARQSAVACSSLAVSVRSIGVMMTCLPAYSAASAFSTPDTSRPVMGWQGTNTPTSCLSTRRAASTTSRLLEPTSMISMSVLTRCRMALSVASVAATGTASSTRSAPETASRAEGASTSITPICSARAVVEGDLL